ncbi:hypothetical protein G6F46_012716 [Rhizopus delemar]|uniref:Reverse transcriptase RNase H-like domain-containing protein n=2 Tax=Rhizopus TaxID=4842 RepID=A0A9P6XQC9_9FUNG|nr:hypothetical protein G6F55_012738 [Rhizopus delemar]KAG1532952.1 hypothetical protein G6F51_012858 [Rhizopus arrhizus]KAG1487563.1 hypothetical protein G6F54_012580 [Rhizopus delemar]KAG1488525.1 hypothetical protein G6F52_013903 [Rhizopus delemar]KAG1493932.1 hypothetical protein G6F53_012662 [Rhizopus delemar]
MNIFKEIEICKAVENDIIYKNIRLTSDLRGRLARWSLYLQQHDYTIIYRPGKENSGPDALSRYPISNPDLCPLTAPDLCSLTAPDLRSSQTNDPFCQECCIHTTNKVNIHG